MSYITRRPKCDYWAVGMLHPFEVRISNKVLYKDSLFGTYKMENGSWNSWNYPKNCFGKKPEGHWYRLGTEWLLITKRFVHTDVGRFSIKTVIKFLQERGTLKDTGYHLLWIDNELCIGCRSYPSEELSELLNFLTNLPESVE